MDFKPVEGVGSPANPANASQIRSDQIDNYPSKSAIGLGVVHVLLGVIVMVFAWGQPGAGTWYCNPDQNYGGHAFYNESNLFWCLGSLLFMASGSLAIAGGCKKTKSLINATFVLSILSAIASFGLIVFASVWIAALQDLDDDRCSGMYYINVALVLTMLIVATISAILAGKMLIEIEIGLGIVHVLIGVIAMVFTGVFFYDDYINQVSNGSGWGFCSVLFMASGSLAIAGGHKKTKSLTIATFVFSIVSAIAAFSLLVFSSVFVDVINPLPNKISRIPGAEIHHVRPDVDNLPSQASGSSDILEQDFDDLARQEFSNFGKDLSHGPVPLEFRIPYYFGIALMLLMLLVATISAILAGKLVYNYSRDQLKQASLATPANASPIQSEKSASNIVIGLGIVHVLIGVIALVFTRVFYHDDYYYYYFSINYSYYYFNGTVSNGLVWALSSVLFMASGSIGIAGGCRETKSLTIATFVFSIISAIVAFSLLVFSSVFVDVIATLPIHFRDPYYLGIGLLLIMQIVATISALQANKLVYNNTREQIKQRLSMQELLQNQEIA